MLDNTRQHEHDLNTDDCVASMPDHFKTFQTLSIPPFPVKGSCRRLPVDKKCSLDEKHKQEILLHAGSFPE